jgi:SAM-dependent methyltransferase/uncharacterized protein YbaR (Trm112 family)
MPITDKLAQILACPDCKSPIDLQPDGIICKECGSPYQVLSGVPVLIKKDSPVLEWYDPAKSTRPTQGNPLKRRLLALRRALLPSQRVWTRKSQQVMTRMLQDKNPDAPDCHIVLIGAGDDPVYTRLLQPYRDIIRCGLSHRGKTTLACDVCDLPFVHEQADLIFSSSVLEHVYDVAQAVSEMHRVLRPGGYVYAEIPFLRAYHMIPHDYQRYTISGIEALFRRHGFETLDVGICSGPFTALVLFLTDFARSMLSFSRPIQMAAYTALSLLLHPMKYLDRWVENAEWAEINACNFYYLGMKA